MTKNNQTQPETRGFQAEIKQLLNLVTHSLYSNKEIFLRELISNASDAADKLRFESFASPALYENDPELKIWVDFDAKARTVTVRDNGVGMNREEAIANLGTIAKSGTREFLAALSGDQAKDAHLIGQFGVGFYSSFVVADKVAVKSRRAGLPPEQGIIWESSGEGDFTVAELTKPERGTEITLHLKKGEDEFLDYWRLQQIVTKYSDHIMLPIVMQRPATEKDKEPTSEVVNKATALWTLAKKEIKDEEYTTLYRHITHDFEDPLVWAHNRVEGKLEYISLLYIPAHAPFDLWNQDKRYGLKLYAQRVFIMDNAEQLLPSYLRFVRGIVDAKDLPLNVSREILQNNKILEQIKNSIVKRILDMLEKMAKDDSEKYAKFWQAFGNVIKEGVVEDFANRDRIAKLFRFASTHSDGDAHTISFEDYIKRMKPEQECIYYIVADSFAAAKNSPHLEKFRQKGIEVLLLSERIDEWWVAQYPEFEKKKLQAITKEDTDLSKFVDEGEKKEQEKLKNEFTDLATKMQKVLEEQVKEVHISNRLTDSPACVVTGANEMSLHLQRLMAAGGHVMPKTKPTLEINPQHQLVQQLKTMSDEAAFAEWTKLLFEQAVIAEGGKLDDPAAFVKRLNLLLSKA